MVPPSIKLSANLPENLFDLFFKCGKLFSLANIAQHMRAVAQCNSAANLNRTSLFFSSLLAQEEIAELNKLLEISSTVKEKVNLILYPVKCTLS